MLYRILNFVQIVLKCVLVTKLAQSTGKLSKAHISRQNINELRSLNTVLNPYRLVKFRIKIKIGAYGKFSTF